MPQTSVPTLILAVIAFCASAYHFLIYARRPTRRVDLTFALTCLMIGFYDLFCVGLYGASSPEVGVIWQERQVLALGLVAIAFVWFISDYTGRAIRPVVYGLTLLYSLLILFNIVTQYHWAWTHEPLIKTVKLPWGGSLDYQEMTAGPSTGVMSLSGALIFIYCAVLIRRLWIRGDRRRVGPLIFGTFAFFLGVVNDAVVSLGLYPGPYLIEYSFLALILVMEWGVIGSVIRTAALEDSIRRSEMMFRNYFRLGVSGMAIIGPDKRWMEVNRRFCELLGYSAEELKKKTWAEVTHPEDLVVERRKFDGLLDGRLDEYALEKRFVRRNGEMLQAYVNATCVRGDNGRLEMVLAVIQDISYRKQAELALQESEQRLRKVMESLPLGIHLYRLDPDNRLVFIGANPGSDRLLKTHHQQFLGKTIEEAFPSLVGTGIPQHYRDVAATGVGWDTEQIQYRDAQITGAYEVHAFQILPGHMAAVFADITERKRAERSLRFMQFALEHGAEAALWFRPNATLFYVNESAEGLLGYSRSELLGLRIFDFDQESTPEKWAEEICSLRTSRVMTRLARFLRKDGGQVPVEIKACHLEYEQEEFIIAFVRDLSERTQAEHERSTLESQMLHVQKLESLGVLAGGIAHDFNNLLMAIMGYADLALLPEITNDELRSDLEGIQKNGRRASELCQQLLAYSGRGRLNRETMDLNAAIREMPHLLSVSISKKAVLRYFFDDSLPRIQADPTQIRQIVMNLITNASDALEDREGFITLRTGVMECSREFLRHTLFGENLPGGSYVFIEVADTGCGMEADVLSRIFDPFFTTKTSGRGLGLAAVLGIIRGHQGTLQVTSRKGSGSLFKVFFPALPAEPEAPAIAVSPASAPEVVEWRGSGTVLLADDEESIRVVSRRMLERMGFQVVTAADGPEVIALLQAEPNRFTAALIDMSMPGLDGVETFQRIRYLLPRLPVLICTGFDEEETARHFVNCKRVSFIQKPFNLEKLTGRLRQLMA
jgi:two-component system cell cycle sensor histidine kinase/response regulator CckA